MDYPNSHFREPFWLSRSGFSRNKLLWEAIGVYTRGALNRHSNEDFMGHFHKLIVCIRHIFLTIRPIVIFVFLFVRKKVRRTVSF